MAWTKINPVIQNGLNHEPMLSKPDVIIEVIRKTAKAIQ